MSDEDREYKDKDYEYLGNTVRALSISLARLLVENTKLKKECKCKCQDKEPELVDFIQAIENLRDGRWNYAHHKSWESELFIYNNQENEIFLCIMHEGIEIETNKTIGIEDIISSEWAEWK